MSQKSSVYFEVVSWIDRCTLISRCIFASPNLKQIFNFMRKQRQRAGKGDACFLALWWRCMTPADFSNKDQDHAHNGGQLSSATFSHFAFGLAFPFNRAQRVFAQVTIFLFRGPMATCMISAGLGRRSRTSGVSRRLRLASDFSRPRIRILFILSSSWGLFSGLASRASSGTLLVTMGRGLPRASRGNPGDSGLRNSCRSSGFR